MSVLIVTSVGDVVVDLHADRCPLTAKNFLKLCKMKYYNGCLFHKVEKDFMAQTGDPTGTGAGGDSVYKFLYGEQARFFKDEIHPDLKHSKMGTVAMASAGEDCNASQVYHNICKVTGILVMFLASCPQYMMCFYVQADPDMGVLVVPVFGLVEEKEGLDTLAKINESLVDDKGRPFKDIREYDLVNMQTAEERLEDTWVPMDEKLAPEELEELIRAKDAHTNAAILESIGDIPDAEIKPPENVLFVCKLNPVTQDEDLFTIFSRFGTVTSADIIRDYKTGDSLCYAFIEFETNEACERAFFKMDNVLIDDRRIHVDFSQSVSKLWNQYRHGKGSQDRKGGCFKCGNTDHIARDCQQGSNNKQQGPKYVLKNDQTQHGGDGRKRYDMVFDEDLEDKNIRYDDKNRADERADDRAHRDHRRSSESSHRPKDERDYRRSESDRYRREDYHERKRRDRDDDDA
ncbi:peptidyl-prolyl cis-trans isomerase CYP59-like [Asparagus officinalis]|uniref:peptidyl-prolyl cis-trans isomerase CYP59-like n=1 Tax=Asparagus officinalis TaxID=4686 RepID=UPI00098E4092|nr:peptidyl-prolyl cis-trans isomerase CYP59-like [Asparagus officinalis]